MRTIFLLVAALCAAAADMRVSGPVLGYVAEGAGIRPVYGIPGAALTGAVVELAPETRLAAVSSVAEVAIVAAGERGAVSLFRLGAEREAVPIEDALAAPEGILISPRGQAALLYRDGIAQAITGLAGRPRAGAATGLEGAVLAVSDRGRALAADGVVLWSLTPDGALKQVMAGEVVAAAFFPGSNNAVFVSDGTVFLLRGGEIVPLASVEGASAVATGGGAVFVATGRSVLRIDLETGQTDRRECDCTVTMLEPMNGGAVFRLNGAGQEPLHVYDGDAPEPRIVFVPSGGLE